MESSDFERYTFLVAGSAAAPYVVTFTKSTKNVQVSCSCPAGIRSTLCKHRIRLINGLMDGVVSGSLENLQCARGWMALDTLDLAKSISDTEKEMELLKNQVTPMRKKLAKAIG